MNAYRDENSVPTIIGVSSSDGRVIVRAEADPVTHRLHIQDGTTGADFGPHTAAKDENDVSTWIACSSADGQTPITLYINANGQLLVDST